MLRLRTFGGVSLYRGEGEPLTGAATQRRRLAILALLAVAGERGVSRDKLLAYLWPESDFERARHTLNQLLHAQRKLFGDLDPFAGRKTLRLNREVVWTDVGEFEEAIARGALDEAVGLYAGPFLDGFFVSGAAEFEQWAQAQRRRLADRFQAALVTLAGRAAESGDPVAASEWWRRAFQQDPFDPAIAASLVHALLETGDRPRALRSAQEHVARLREELGVEPDARFLSLLRELRRGGPAGG